MNHVIFGRTGEDHGKVVEIFGICLKLLRTFSRHLLPLYSALARGISLKTISISRLIYFQKQLDG